MGQGSRSGRGDRSEGTDQPIEFLDPTGKGIGATPDPDGSGDPADEAADSTELLGQATAGGGFRWILTLGAVVLGLGGVIALLVGIDRAAPDPPPVTANAGPVGPTPTAVSRTTAPYVVRTVVTTAPPTTLPAGEFLLGEETNLWLFYGGDDLLQRVDLDNGEVLRFGARAYPAATTGGELIYYQPAGRRLAVVPISAPGQQPYVWKSGLIALDAAPGLLWTLDPGIDFDHPAGVAVGYGQWELAQTASSKIVAQRPGDLYDITEARRDELNAIGGVIEIIRPGPDYAVRPEGIVRYTDAGYDLLIPGSAELHLHYQGRGLVKNCEDAETGRACQFSWVGIESGEKIPDLPIPRANAIAARLFAGFRWLYAVEARGESELIDLQTDRRLRFPADVIPTVSADGRWLAVIEPNRLVVADLTTGREVAVIDGLDRAGATGRANGALFVEQSQP